MTSPEEFRQENRRIRAFRILTDLTFQRLCLERMTIGEACEAVFQLKRVAINMFPEKGEVFDLVIAPRLNRVITERFGESTLFLN